MGVFSALSCTRGRHNETVKDGGCYIPSSTDGAASIDLVISKSGRIERWADLDERCYRASRGK